MHEPHYNLTWKKYTKRGLEGYITEYPTMTEIIQQLIKDNPKVVAIDTETTGLNLVRDTPFLFIIAWKVPGENIGYSYALPYNSHEVNLLYNFLTGVDYIVGANIKFDLHMLRNGGSPMPQFLLDKVQLTDTMIMRRLTLPVDATIAESKLALKHLAVVFVDNEANTDEHLVKDTLKKQNAQYRKIGNALLKQHGSSLKKIEEGLETNQEALVTYETWKNTYGTASYYTVWKEHETTMNKYAVMDGVLTIEVFLHLYNDLMRVSRTTTQDILNVWKEENDLIPIYYEQERIGFKVDLEYLKAAQERVRKYNEKLEKQLHVLLGKPLSQSQNAKLMEALQEAPFNVESRYFEVQGEYKMDKNVIKKLQKHPNVIVKAIADTISRLRRGAKWLSTYIDGIYEEVIANGDERLHPLTQQAGTVSGRIAGNMQQMPKDPLVDEDGNELFHPRKIIIPSGNEYTHLVLQDFDQMELRVQADYTIQFGCTDENLCRIFIPYGYSYNQKEYDINNAWCKQHYDDKDATGKSIWVKDGEHWVPTDPHSMQVTTAFGLTKPKDDTTPEFKQFKHLRNAAKTINFAINYGSGLRGLIDNPMLEEYPEETITAIYDAYKTNFKGVTKYQEIVDSWVNNHYWIANRYGRVYLVKDKRWAYKCANYLIQGSCADLVKQCLLSITKLFKQHNAKSRILYTIHDEIIWELHKDEAHLIRKVEHILNETASWCRIPLTCGTDLAVTNWSEKKDIANYKEFACIE